MLERKFRLAVATTALALAALGAGGAAAAASTAAPVHAASSTPAVASSDTIDFTGVAVPANGTYTLNTNQATILPAGSSVRYPAWKSLQFGSQTLAGTSRTTSAVGVQVFNFKLVRSGNSTFNLVDAGGSYETTPNGAVVPATGSGAISATPITGTPNLKITGTVNIFK